jgi:competence protein ComEA
MEQRTLLAAGIVAAAALAAGWRNLASGAPVALSVPSPAFSASNSPGAEPARASPQAPAASVVVYVTGEVRKPGLYTLPATARAGAALAAAGGSTAAADLVAVNLAERLSDGEAFVVPPKGGAFEPRAPSTRRRGRAAKAEGSGSASGASPGRKRKRPPASPIDVNAAAAAELERLPGIGPSLAGRIVAFREINGRFTRIDDLLDVAGMSERKLEDIAPYVLLR